MEEFDDEVVNIIGLDSDNLLYVEDDLSESLIKDDDACKGDGDEMVDSKTNEKKKRGRKKSIVKRLPKGKSCRMQ